MSTQLSRRDILKLGTLSLGGLALGPFQPQREDFPLGELGRVAVPAISVHREPVFESPIVGQRFRDELLHIYYELTPPSGPSYNPLWYRVWGGYAHSAHIQPVHVDFHRPEERIAEVGQLFEVSVPYITSWQHSKAFGWQPSTRLYYQSVHWATSIEEGPDGRDWYKLTSELWDTDYFVPRALMRKVDDRELEPISPDVPPEEKHIVVRLDQQTLTAYEGDEIVMHTTISSGLRVLTPGPNGIPTETPKGNFAIEVKLPSKHMGQGRLTDSLDDYVLLGVPWTSFFHHTGVAFHGTYWHNNFGSPMSHGCINMRNHEANWLFRWTNPLTPPGIWEERGRGTTVRVVG